ncbi:MAG: peptidylprolyl isomerase [Nitrospiraceae bacterium]|nr:peptidylprolyl isomerase [Nitrospiraceae bacterium]
MDEATRKACGGDAVKVHYTGKFSDGSVFDSSKDREPLQFTIGAGQLIAGFEKAVEGMAAGETKTVMIPPGSGYGARREELVFRVKKEHFPPMIEQKIGVFLELRQPDGGIVEVQISDITADLVVLDGNHPLAGKDLHFDIELVAISGPAAV